jgi:hypothetical protein
MRRGRYWRIDRASPEETTGARAAKDIEVLPPILVVEDERMVALDLTQQLTRLEYSVQDHCAVVERPEPWPRSSSRRTSSDIRSEA